MLRAQRKEIYNRFKNFLRTYVDTRGHNLYRKLIQDMCSLNKSSFEVSVISWVNIQDM
jgi:DNA replication licensing factor MCM2